MSIEAAAEAAAAAAPTKGGKSDAKKPPAKEEKKGKDEVATDEGNEEVESGQPTLVAALASSIGVSGSGLEVFHPTTPPCPLTHHPALPTIPSPSLPPPKA